MSDVRLTSDVVVLDSALMNSYSQHVLEGKSLNIQYGTYITMQQATTGDSISINISRAASILKTIFCSFDHDFIPSDQQKIDYPFFLVKTHGTIFITLWPTAQDTILQIPEFPCRSLSNAHSDLKKALGILGAPWHSISPSYQQFCIDHFIIGVDCERSFRCKLDGVKH